MRGWCGVSGVRGGGGVGWGDRGGGVGRCDRGGGVGWCGWFLHERCAASLVSRHRVALSNSAQEMHHLESVLRGGHHERIVAQLVASIDVGTAFHDRLSDLQNWGGVTGG